MLNRPRRSLPAVLAFPTTMIVSCFLVSGCGHDNLSDDPYGFIDLAPYYYDGSSAANPSAGLAREIPPTKGWLNGVRAEYYDFGLVGTTKKRSAPTIVDYASIPAMYFFYDSSGAPMFSKPIFEARTGLWHIRGGNADEPAPYGHPLDPNPCIKCVDDGSGRLIDAPKNVPYSVRVRRELGEFQRPIIDRLQNNADYSGLWEIWEVTAPDGYVADSIKSFGTLQKAVNGGTFAWQRTLKVINCPVIDDRQYVTPSPLFYGIPHPRIELWSKTKMGSCFLADGWFALADSSGKLFKAGDSHRLNMMDIITYTIGQGDSARTTITAPVSKVFVPTSSVPTQDARGTVDIRYTGDNVTDVLPRMNPGDPPGYRPIRWLWDLKVPADPPYVAASYRSTATMDPAAMVSRTGGPYTKNMPLIGVSKACDLKTGMLTDGSMACGDLPHAPNAILECSGSVIPDPRGATYPPISDYGGARCDIPAVRFAEFCAPGIAACRSFDPKKDTMLDDSTHIIDPATMSAKHADGTPTDFPSAIGGYICQPNGPQGGYCFMRCDTDASAGSKSADKVSIKYKGPDGQVKVDNGGDGKGIDMPYDQRCGNIPGYKCLNPTGTIVPNQARVCLRSCDSGKPDAFNDVFCGNMNLPNPAGMTPATVYTVNEKVPGTFPGGNFQKGQTCSTRGLNGASACQWDPVFEPRDPDPHANFVPTK
jgi:hypothetical protein